MHVSTSSSEDLVKAACRALVGAGETPVREDAAAALARISELLVLKARLQKRAELSSSKKLADELAETVREVETRLLVASERALALVRGDR